MSDDWEASEHRNGKREQGATTIFVIKDEFIPLGNLYENKRGAVAPGLVVRKEEGDGRREGERRSA